MKINKSPIFISFGFVLLTSIAKAAPEHVPGEYIVKLWQPDSRQILEYKKQATIISEEDGIYKLKFVSQEQEKIFNSKAKRKEFKHVEPNFIFHNTEMTNDPRIKNQWGLFNKKSGINIEKAWELTTGSEKVVVAVIDTGIDFTHPELAENMWQNTAETNGEAGVDDDGNGYIDDIYGFNFSGKKTSPKDDHGHGTHCAGVVGASSNNAIGIASPNWNVRLMAIKFLDSQGSGTSENALKAMNYAIKMKANIMSNSWGGDGFSDIMLETIQKAQDAGILFVAAAGNASKNNDKTPFYPASYKAANVISVAATDSSGRLASFSNYGVTSVDIAAPGEAIYSTTPKSSYQYMSGTSMATPFVAAVAAQILSVDLSLSAEEVKEKIMNGARPVEYLKKKVKSGATLDAFGALKD